MLQKEQHFAQLVQLALPHQVLGQPAAQLASDHPKSRDSLAGIFKSIKI